MALNEYSDLPEKFRRSMLDKINDNYKPLVDAVRDLEVCVGYREYVRHCVDPNDPTMTVQKADRDVNAGAGRSSRKRSG